MKWAIILLIMLSLIGSMLWVMPSPRQRVQAKLRLDARKLGFHVTIAQLTLPRATGEVEPEVRKLPVYRKVRDNLTKAEKNNWLDWSVCRVVSQGNTGLPQGWSWISGEYQVPPAVLARLVEWLDTLPNEVIAVESKAVHLSLYWTEPDRSGALDELGAVANAGLEAKL